MHNSVNILKASELHTLNGETVWCELHFRKMFLKIQSQYKFKYIHRLEKSGKMP